MEDLKKEEVQELAQKAVDGKIQIEIVNRKGEAKGLLSEVAELEVKRLEMYGDISTVYNMLSVRHGLFKPDECHIAVDVEGLFISFTGNEVQAHNKKSTFISGKMEKSKEYTDLPLEKDYLILEFAKYVRKNKNIFASEKEWNEIFKSYSNCNFKIEKETEQIKDRTGNETNAVRQKVIHELKQEFKILIPLVEGGELVSINIEVDVEPNLTCSLFAPDIEKQFKEESLKMLNKELDKEIDGKPMSEFCVTYFK